MNLTRTHTLLRPTLHVPPLLHGRAAISMMDLSLIPTSIWRSHPANLAPVSQFSVMKMASHIWNWAVPLLILIHTPVTVAIIQPHHLVTLHNHTIKPTPVLALMVNQILTTIPDKVIAQIPIHTQVAKTMVASNKKMGAVMGMVQILMVVEEAHFLHLVGLQDVCLHIVTQLEVLQDLPVIINNGFQCSTFPCTN